MKFHLARIEGKRRLFTSKSKLPKGVASKEINIPTDQERLGKFIEGMFDKLDAAPEREQEPVETVQPAATVPDREHKWKGNLAAVQAGEKCPACARSAAGAKLIASSYALTDLEEAIQFVSDPVHLDKVVEAVAARRKQIVPNMNITSQTHADA